MSDISPRTKSDKHDHSDEADSNSKALSKDVLPLLHQHQQAKQQEQTRVNLPEIKFHDSAKPNFAQTLPNWEDRVRQLRDPFRGQMNEISSSLIEQGQFADCFFLSGLADLADTARGKQIIKEMITTNSDGSYTVRFLGDSDHPLTVVSKELNNEHLSNPAKWANIIEAAYLKYINCGRMPEKPDGTLFKHFGIPVFGKGVGPRDALHLLTGLDAATDPFALTDLGSQQVAFGATSPQNVAADLEKALKNGLPVTACTTFEYADFALGHSPGPLPASHNYSVLDYDSKRQAVTVRNPWGHMEGTAFEHHSTVNGITSIGDGKLKMSLPTFMHYFSDINVAGVNPHLNNVIHVLRDTEGQLERGFGMIEALKQGDFARTGKEMTAYFGHTMYSMGETTYGIMKPLSDLLSGTVRSASQMINEAVTQFTP